MHESERKSHEEQVSQWRDAETEWRFEKRILRKKIAELELQIVSQADADVVQRQLEETKSLIDRLRSEKQRILDELRGAESVIHVLREDVSNIEQKTSNISDTAM